MEQPLFLDRLPELDKSFRKEAGFASRLSENVDNWPQELASELYKQLPFLSDYEVNVNLAKVEPQRGFAFGYADVSNKTERPEIEHTDAGLPHIRIPLVIEERSVKPFSIFLDGEKVLPLNEERVREILFNPATFDLSTSQPRDPSLVEPLMPPQRSGMGQGGEYKQASASFEKTAAMKTVEKYYGDGGLQEIVDMWMAEFTRLNSQPIVDGEKVAMVKEAFNHISKPQWDAIYKSDRVQKAIAKNGTVSHPEVTNTVYETASKVYGFHPKVYTKPPEMKAIEQKSKDIAKSSQTPKGGSSKPKTASAPISLLMAIAPTIREKDRDAFVEKVASDPTLRAGFARSGIGKTLVEVMDGEKYASTADMMRNLADRIEPTAVTVQKLPGGDFLIKSANTGAFNPEAAQGQTVPGEEAEEAIGQEQAMAMQPGQVATAVADPAEETSLFPTNEKVVDEFGEWLVQDAMGNKLMGWVFPQTLAWDGEFSPQPIALFTNGSAYALQDSIAGELIGKGMTFPADAPRGDGVFYATEGGKAVCTAPITVGSASIGPDGAQVFLGQDLFGNQVQIHLAEGIGAPTRVSDVEYALPMSWKFMRLNGQTQLAQDPSQMQKTAALKMMQSGVTLFYNGSFNLEGGCGLNKLAHDFRYDLDPVSTEFMLGVLGLEGPKAKVKMAEARKKGQVKIAGLKTITLLSERFAQETKTASALISKIPNLRRDLTKEAAAMADESTVDNLLALNFINPENLGIFVSYMPTLEETSEKMAEMLLSSYLGMKELPESALERGMKNLEEVLTSLKAIQHAEA